MNKISKKIKNNKKGFTLVEIMVSISVFAIVMLMVSSSIFTIFDSNRKSQSLRAVMDNLNLSLESMTRTIRFGKNYHCNISSGTQTIPLDCPGGASSIAVEDSNGGLVTYRLENGRIIRNKSGQESFVTGADVTIDNLKFWVLGTTNFSSLDYYQPKVLMVISGYAGPKLTSRSSFTLQTTLSQRQFDSQ